MLAVSGAPMRTAARRLENFTGKPSVLHGPSVLCGVSTTICARRDLRIGVHLRGRRRPARPARPPRSKRASQLGRLRRLKCGVSAASSSLQVGACGDVVAKARVGGKLGAPSTSSMRCHRSLVGGADVIQPSAVANAW